MANSTRSTSLLKFPGKTNDIPLKRTQKNGGRLSQSVAVSRLSNLLRSPQHLCHPPQAACNAYSPPRTLFKGITHYTFILKVVCHETSVFIGFFRPTGRSRPYWMTQRKADRAVFESVSCGESRFYCRSAHPDVRLVPAGGLVRQGRCAWFVSSFLFVLFILKLTQFDEIIHRYCAPSEITVAAINGTGTA